MDSDRRIRWYRSPLPREKLIELNVRSDMKGFMHILPFLLMAMVTGSLAFAAFYHTPIPVFAAALFLHCTLFQFFGRVAASHELCHHTVFRRKFLNELFVSIFTFFAWENRVYYKARHDRHHQYTAHNEEDAELYLPIILTWRHWLAYVTFDFQKLAEALKLNTLFSLGIVKGRMNRVLFPESDPQNRTRLFRWARILLGGHLVLAAVFAGFQLWPLLLIVTLAPFMCQWLNMLTAYPQHVGMQPEVSDFRLCCRTYDLGPVLSFLYFNMQYHTEHHMYASVPFYNLPKLRKAVEHDLPKSSGPLAATWKEMIGAMKKQKSDPAYYLPVQLPNSMIEPERD